ncbi:cytochrome P450 [Artomyces pyxidatus]|uniref:Cytochrome P450 n=1 Tax=Artomyces pyxidatus TaxID=48021 RepID=A0ACB8SSR0_9AGAM|nr:cytochrome P450 [Artomyces pyxidatus]
MVILWHRTRVPELDIIPTIGYSAPLLSYVTAIKFLFRSFEMMQEGYEKYKPGLFKIAMLNSWTIVATGHEFIDDIRKAPDNVLSFDEATYRVRLSEIMHLETCLNRCFQSLQVKYTLGDEVHHDPYHIPIIRSQLTRNLGKLFADVRDELVAAFNDQIPVQDDWVKVPITTAIQQIVCRTSNRIFVGTPACRNEDYQRLNIDFTVDVVKDAIVINLFPDFLKPFIAPLVTQLPSHIKRQMKHLNPIIEERRQKLAEFGDDWEDKPNDMLMWFMSEAKGEEQTFENLARRVLTLNFAAIHTSSLSFTHAIYHLAANPEYIQPMRDEVEAVVAAEGWTKASLQKMRKVDSFLRESQRFNGLGLVTMARLVLQPFTFSNGVTVPAGTTVVAASSATHHDTANYENAEVFDGFRFADLRDEDGEGLKHQMVSTQTDYLAFGHGRHACPGRFFAANELKAMLAHVVVTYDVKFEDGKGFPPNKFIGEALIPGTSDVLFRKRQT